MLLINLVLAGTFFTAIILVSKRWKWKPPTQNPPKQAPEPAGGWPVIGHLLQLNSHPTLFRSLSAMADKYGSIFRIRVGTRKYIVVSDWESAKQCFTTNDKIFASRPESNAAVYLGYNYAGFGNAPYGPYWREIRKIVAVEVLSSRRLESLRQLRVTEIGMSIGELFTSDRKVVMSEWFEQLSLNIIVRTIAGKRYADTEAAAKVGGARYFSKLVKDFMSVSGQYGLSDIAPVAFLRWVDNVVGHVKSMKRIGKELDCVMQSWIDEHSRRRAAGAGGCREDQDFIDVMLSAVEDDSVFGHSRDTVIKATIQTLILAGSDTTSVLLTWILCLLLNNKHSMQKAQQEIDNNVGKERWVQESDVKNLVYLRAIVKEALRLYPSAPMSLPHLAMNDTEVGGFQVPKGTGLLVNLWKLHRDPTIWSEPDEFLPERFLTGHSEVDLSGHHFEFIPFGSGRRACPGSAFAMQVTHLTLGRLLQGFHFETPGDIQVDMAEGGGLTLPKANPLEVLVKPRLANALYGIH